MPQETKFNNIIEMDPQFYERVYAQVAIIPFGKVSTYGKIAELAGYPRASREVGLAMSQVRSGSNLPCHRVVNKNGTMAPGYAFGSKEQQRKMLKDEGIAFHENGNIDMQKHMWPNDFPVDQLSLL